MCIRDRPLRPGLHTCYNGGYRRQLPGDMMLIPKTSLSSDRSLQPDFVKLDSLVIACLLYTSDLEEVMKAAVKSPNQVLFLTGVFPSGKRGYFAVDLTQE